MRYLLTLILLALLAAGVWWAVRTLRPPGAMTVLESQAMDMTVMKAPPGVMPVATQEVKESEFAPMVTYPGSVAAMGDQEVVARTTGVVVEMLAYPGDFVQPDQLLVRLDSAELASRQNEAAAGVREQASEVELARAEHTASLREADAASSEIAIRKAEVREAGQMASEARAELTLSQAEYERTRSLFDQGGESQEELQRARAQLDQARARYESSRENERKARLAIAQAGLESNASRAKADSAASEVGVRRAALERSQAEEATARVMLGYTEIRAAGPGQVTERVVSPGTLVMPGQVLLRVKQVERLRLQARVPVEQAWDLRVGNAVLASVGEREIETRVSSVFRAADPASRTMVVEALAPALPDLVPGGYVRMRIALGRPRQTLTIPVAALQEDAQGQGFAWVVEKAEKKGPTTYTCTMHPEVVMDHPGRCPKCGMDLVPRESQGDLTVRRARLEPGQVDGTRVEVRSGLSPGQRVVVEGFQDLTEGMPVAEVPWGPQGPLELPPPPGAPADHSGHGSHAGQSQPSDHDEHSSHAGPGPASPDSSPSASETDSTHNEHSTGEHPGTHSEDPPHIGQHTPAHPSPSKTATATYTCPMHPEVVSDHPGRCPKCGMDLVKKKTEARATYTCPMHPEVVSDHPGRCPRCGMDLVKKP